MGSQLNICSYNYVLNLFYEIGCPFEDQGFLSFAIWRNNFRIAAPPAIEAVWNGGMLQNHLTLIFFITSFLSKFLNLDMIHFFAFYQGLTHGLLAFSMFFVLCRIFQWQTKRGVAFSFFIALLFSFNGMAVSSMLYPHHEMMFISLAAFFLLFLTEKNIL